MPNEYGRATPKEVAESLGELTNWGGAQEEQEFAAAIMREHRTLQQKIMRLFLATCKNWAAADKPGWYDARNEDTIKAAVKIVETTKDCYFPHI